MYIVLGADRKPYGPVNADVVRRWIGEGRANEQTLVQPPGATDWKPLREIPEFAQALAAKTRPPATPAPAGASLAAAPVKTSGLAIASLVLGILGLASCGVTAFVGVILGIVGLTQIHQSRGRYKGRGLAIAGICVSTIIMIGGAVLLAARLAQRPGQTRGKTNQPNCISNLHQLGMMIRMYANDQSDRFPLASNWCDTVRGYVGSDVPFRCSSAHGAERCTYGYNSRLSGLEDIKIDPHTVLLFEIDGGWNRSGGRELVLRQPRHGFIGICYADGTTEQVSPSRLDRLRWEP